MQQDLRKEDFHQAQTRFSQQQEGITLDPDAAPLQGAVPQGTVLRNGADNVPERVDGDGSAMQGRAVRVLFVDDHEDMRGMMQLLMKRRSYAVETAGSARAALEIAPRFAPDIIVSDIGMPEMDGYDLMVALRADTRMPHFKSIALTGYSLPSDRERACETGFDACLSKPVSFTALFDLIDDLSTALSGDSQ
jgi:CheY-like chemotaxis protein